MRPALAAGVACAITATTLARIAHAGGPRFALDYEAPAACLNETAFLTEVRSRVTDRPEKGADERRFRVRIADRGGTYQGALETLDPPSVREVSGKTCEEVVRALVVFVALALSPEAPATNDAPAPDTPDPPEENKTPVVEPPRAPVVRDVPQKQQERAPTPPFLGVDIRALAATGVTPGIAPGAALAGRLVLQGHRPSLRWVVHAGGLVVHREEPVLQGAFTFLWAAARVDAGPALDLGLVRVSGGPALRAGLLSVEARDLPSAGRYSSFWGDVGGFVRVDRSLSSWISVSLMVELAVPVQRRTFGIAGIDEPVHEVAPVLGLASLGLTLGQ
jgi:hypothetical protein